MQATVPEGAQGAVTRLAAMPGQKRLAGVLAVAAAAVALSACGSSSSDKTIDPVNANQLISALSGVQSAVESGNCRLAQAEAGHFVDVVNGLPDTVGAADKEALRNAGDNLETLAQDKSQCEPTNTTGASGPSGDQSTTSSTATATVPTTTATTTSTSTTSASPPANPGGGNDGGGATGGGPAPTPGGGNTGGGEPGGGGGGSGGGTGTGGTGSGGGGGTG
jgi:hypothetical protein